MSNYSNIKIGSFLFERAGRYKPSSLQVSNLKRIDKIDFNGNITLGNNPSKTDMILVKNGDLVISGINISKGAMAIYHGDEDVTATIHYSSYTFDTNIINMEYFEYFLRSTVFTKLLKEQVKGGIKTEIKAKTLLQIRINLPDITTQKQNVEKLKTSLQKIDSYNNSNILCEKYIDLLTKQIIQDAITGKLSEDWREKNKHVKPAPLIINKILQVKNKLLLEKKLRVAEKIVNTKTTRDLQIPISWTWCKADELFFITKLAGFEYTKYIHLQERGDVPVIRAQNVKPLGIRYDDIKYIDKNTSFLLERSALVRKSLLMTFIGAGIGDVTIFNNPERWHLAPNVAKLEPFIGSEEYLDLKFLHYYLLSKSGRKEIFKHVKATAQPSLSMGTIRDIDFAFPPIEEQKYISAKVDSLLNKLREIEKNIENGSKQRAFLTQYFLQKTYE